MKSAEIDTNNYVHTYHIYIGTYTLHMYNMYVHTFMYVGTRFKNY